ncbi:MAG: acetyl xylan esterase [Calditrichaeota bacterium]|nr:acetyl xylan esterase [Calditrichota bacterium]MCB0267071.1 acetyl xylan esterase [Calditrichota bacterium]
MIVDISADHPHFQYIGRFDRTDPQVPHFSWSGSCIRFRFFGSDLGIFLRHLPDDPEHTENVYTVIIDNNPPQLLHAAPEKNEYRLAENLPEAAHSVTIFRRTEAMCGVGIFEGIRLNAGGLLLSPPQLPQRKIEFIGDSITCGFGNEAASETEGFTAATEDGYRAFGAIASRKLDAEYRAICFSGRGVHRNYDGSRTGLLPELFEQIYPQSPQKWQFSQWQPDVAVVNLGTNDFANGIPEATEFIGDYSAFLGKIRVAYPAATIICLDGPMLSGDALSTCQHYIKQAVTIAEKNGDSNVFTFSLSTQGENGFGADWHPNVAQHEKNADELVAFFNEKLNW